MRSKANPTAYILMDGIVIYEERQTHYKEWCFTLSEEQKTERLVLVFTNINNVI